LPGQAQSRKEWIMPEKKAEAKTEAPAAGEAGARRKKINELTLAEIEARLADCREKQGSLHSKYARQLLARKKVLAAKA
jgi:hypothetical protein